MATLVNETVGAGQYEAVFDAGRLSSGTYIYRLQAGGYSLTRSMILIKQVQAANKPGRFRLRRNLSAEAGRQYKNGKPHACKGEETKSLGVGTHKEK